ncbi:MAG: hypothetical protein U1D30_26075 [Planctomycetota bacterium]
MSMSAFDIAGPMPRPISAAWTPWITAVIDAWTAYCNVQRTTTRYVAANGSDSNPGTELLPWRTIEKANTAIQGSAGNIAVLFRRGDTFRGTLGLSLTLPNVTIGAYGSGDRPVLSAFSVPILKNTAQWTSAGNNRYTYPFANRIGWLREATNIISQLSAYAYRTSTAAVEVNPGSWYWSSGVLHVHARGSVDPNTIDFEAIDGGAWASTGDVVTRGDGVFIQGDGSFVDDVDFHGWGCDATKVWQNYGVKVANESGKLAVVRNSDTYYSGRHGPSTLGSNSGGLALFQNCACGYMNSTASGVNAFNAYQSIGDHQVIFDNCNARFGRAPDSAVDGVTTKYDAASDSYYGHTGGTGFVALFVVRNCRTSKESYPGATFFNGLARFSQLMSPGNENDPDSWRIVIENYRVTHRDECRLSMGPRQWEIGTWLNIVWKTTGENTYLTSGETSLSGGIRANGVYVIEDTIATNRSLLHTSTTSTTKFWNCHFALFANTGTVQRWRIQNTGSGNDSGVYFANCLLTRAGNRPFEPHITNDAEHWINCSGYQVLADGTANAMNAAGNNLVMTAEPAAFAIPETKTYWTRTNFSSMARATRIPSARYRWTSGKMPGRFYPLEGRSSSPARSHPSFSL